MAWLTIRPNNSRSNFQRLQDFGCTSDYFKTKTDIEQKIDAIPYKTSNLFCKKCIALKNDINQKSKGLQQCYNSSKLLPIENTDKIKEFISKCPDLHKCLNPPNKPVSKTVVSKGQKADSCPGSRNCTEKIVTPDDQKSKAPPGIPAGISQARRSEENASLKEDRDHSDGEQLRDGKVILQTKPEANPLGDSVRTQDEGSKSTVNLPSVSTEETATPMQYVSSPSPSANVELGTPSSAHSSQSSATRGSHSSSSTQQEDLNKGGPTTNIAGVQTDSNNQLQTTPVVAQNNQGLAHDNAHAIETSAERDSDSTSSRGDKADYGEFISEDTIDRVSIDKNGHALVYRGNTDSTGSHIQIANSGDLGVRDESHGITNTESIHHTNGSDVDITRVEVPSSVLTSGNTNELGIFNQIFSTIQQNKENVINTSIPMGIVLLLSLLFKYTPLWRILTKRNRKKQSHMNEKLQRVLQQPSIGSGERSIPFSYSAFEYSS
ncbi:VIR protein [Plasmodium vivax]|uniref:VIR protein n=1 Tax=Plasmodium vivax TaxID=5855 RepID=A0A1G4E8X7_PLAVI|nr:VIR protein [Plasmodium vivax]